MKKTILLILFTFFCFSVFSQDTILNTNNDTITTIETLDFDRCYSIGYRLIGEESLGLEFNHGYSYSFSIINGYQLNKHLFTGLKLGYRAIGDITKSLCGEFNFRINFLDNKVSPYICASIGLTQILNSTNADKLFIGKNASFGIQVYLSKKLMIHGGLGLDVTPVVSNRNTQDTGYLESVETGIISIILGCSIW